MGKRIDSFTDLLNDILERKVLSPNSKLELAKGERSAKAAGIPTIGELEMSLRAIASGFDIGGSDSAPLLPSIENYIDLVRDLGATFMTSEQALKTIPPLGSVAALTAGENEEIAEGASAIATLSMTAHRISYSQPVSKLLLRLGGPSFNDLFIRAIMEGISKKLQDLILGVQARSETVNQGMLYKITSGTDTTLEDGIPTRITIENHINEVADLGYLTGKLAFVTNGRGRSILAKLPVETGHPARLLENGKLNGYPCFISNSVSNACGSLGVGTGLIFGNWQDLLICQIGPWNITIDEMTQARASKAVVTVTGFFDALGARGSASTGSGSDANEYHGSFASRAIKLNSGNQSY